MKYFVLALALMANSSVWARQYIQCSILSETTDVAVVNLETNKTGTLFLSSGMQNPEDERILLKIEFDKKENGLDVFKVLDANTKASVSVPSEVVGKSSDSLVIHLAYGNLQFDYSCFARIYND
jgi:hypothetical protein